MAKNGSKPLVVTLTDEAPFRSTVAFLPVMEAFLGQAGIPVERCDISVAARILAACNNILPVDKRVPDGLGRLATLVTLPDSVFIKNPNVSASRPQIMAAIKELQEAGFEIPNYDVDTMAIYDVVLGSAVNPVIRGGNADRRVPDSVKNHARRNPPKYLAWAPMCKTRVASMPGDDFLGNEKSFTTGEDTVVEILFVGADGKPQVLKKGLKVAAGTIVDTTFMSVEALRRFIRSAMDEARAQDLLFSVHLKATMMKTSDPVIFGQIIAVFLASVFDKHAAVFRGLGVNPNDGLASIFARVEKIEDTGKRDIILTDIRAALSDGPALAMVDSAKGITNLHAPNLVIVDASMPKVIRDGGGWWNAEGNLQSTLALIPDRSYAGLYQATIDDCVEHGALDPIDPRMLGTVQCVGLMAFAAEEYGSHGTTYFAPEQGFIRVIAADGRVLSEHRVSRGDIWRMCRTQQNAVEDWVRLAVKRAGVTGYPAVFWLDQDRPHDREVLQQVEGILCELDTDGLEIHFMTVAEATKFSLGHIREGENVIAVTGNVLRDWVTDLFPILEVGTSADTLSLVPMLAGGLMVETGSGGSAPEHVKQFAKEGHLRWSPLGELLGLVEALRFIVQRDTNERAQILMDALDRAIVRFLEENRRPGRNVGTLDTRGSQFYATLFWAEELARQNGDTAFRDCFAPVAEALRMNEAAILAEFAESEGHPVDLGGYFYPDPERVNGAMRPSSTFNTIIASLVA